MRNHFSEGGVFIMLQVYNHLILHSWDLIKKTSSSLSSKFVAGVRGPCWVHMFYFSQTSLAAINPHNRSESISRINETFKPQLLVSFSPQFSHQTPAFSLFCRHFTPPQKNMTNCDCAATRKSQRGKKEEYMYNSAVSDLRPAPLPSAFTGVTAA